MFDKRKNENMRVFAIEEMALMERARLGDRVSDSVLECSERSLHLIVQVLVRLLDGLLAVLKFVRGCHDEKTTHRFLIQRLRATIVEIRKRSARRNLKHGLSP